MKKNIPLNETSLGDVSASLNARSDKHLPNGNRGRPFDEKLGIGLAILNIVAGFVFILILFGVI